MKSSTTWMILEEVDELMADVLDWQQVNWSNERARDSYVKKKFTHEKKHRPSHGYFRKRYAEGKTLC
jgi:hypothetical protein